MHAGDLPSVVADWLVVESGIKRELEPDTLILCGCNIRDCVGSGNVLDNIISVTGMRHTETLMASYNYYYTVSCNLTLSNSRLVRLS